MSILLTNKLLLDPIILDTRKCFAEIIITPRECKVATLHSLITPTYMRRARLLQLQLSHSEQSHSVFMTSSMGNQRAYSRLSVDN